MTNVKLKLMYYLLNALLTADIVHSRPYSDLNTTDIVIKFPSNNTFNLPVDPNSDTLIVANDDETPEETNVSSNSNMEAIVNAEQDRDEEISVKTMNKQIKTLEMAKDDAKAIEKQLNISSSLLEDIMNSEADREETITDILFKPESEFAEVPRFEFLIAGKINESDFSNRSANEISDLRNDRNSSDVLKKVDYVELVEVGKPMGGDNKSAYMANITSHEVDNDLAPDTNVSSITAVDIFSGSGPSGDKSLELSFAVSSLILMKESSTLLPPLRPEPLKMSTAVIDETSGTKVSLSPRPNSPEAIHTTRRFTDVQTLFLACFGTLLPLLLVLFGALIIRCLCRRYCPGFCKKPSPSSVSESSEKQDASRQQLKSPTEEGTRADATGDGETPPPNGSIFTMTLKNNHLIVETEERNDITRNGRETKMKYSPDNDGIFVVEVQQSTAYRPNNKSSMNSPPRDPQISTNQALIHRVPEELERKIDEDSEQSSDNFARNKALALSSTGLSISDLSMSSIGSHNVSYSYGSQMGYEQGPFGYPIYAGYEISKENVPEGIINDNSQEPLICNTPMEPEKPAVVFNNKPVVTAAIFKQDSIIGSDALQGPGYCIEGSTDGPLLSDVQAREYSLHHLQEQKKVENGVAVPIDGKIESPKKNLNRADSLPVRLEEEKAIEPVEVKPTMETINEDDFPSKDSLKGKRASLPIIRTEMYESVKDVIIPSGSPKFEKLLNETSPGDNTFDSPPMITITEESESSKSEGTS